MDWNSKISAFLPFLLSHTLYGCVDWNLWNVFMALNGITSHPLWVCGLKLTKEGQLCAIVPRHHLYGCVDWNYVVISASLAQIRHTLYGCVDWNIYHERKRMVAVVTPFMGVWIEICLYIQNRIPSPVTPFMGVWIEILQIRSVCHRKWWSHPLWVCGLKSFGNHYEYSAN